MRAISFVLVIIRNKKLTAPATCHRRGVSWVVTNKLNGNFLYLVNLIRKDQVFMTHVSSCSNPFRAIDGNGTKNKRFCHCKGNRKPQSLYISQTNTK